ncbi:MAG: nucleotide exchange factor GrpE [Patescibacteria group bacterium]
MTKDDKGHKKQIEDLTNRWKRALADYQNLEKRIDLEKEDFVEFANSQLILKILPAIDSLEKAEKHLKDQGLSLALKQLKEGLTQEGLEKIQTQGKDFNPEEMECIDVCQGEEGKVLDEIRSGYKLGNRVLRVAQVKVGKEKIDEKVKELAREQLTKGDYM